MIATVLKTRMIPSKFRAAWPNNVWLPSPSRRHASDNQVPTQGLSTMARPTLPTIATAPIPPSGPSQIRFLLSVCFVSRNTTRRPNARRVILRSSATGKIIINFRIYTGLLPKRTGKTVAFTGHITSPGKDTQTVQYRLRVVPKRPRLRWRGR
ncbi:hypothetical protein BGW80DRAFT_684924 [Lactifluus volemus]|nr:hypothetical protein BGW80DRAFT_684924 [Lactifluus volemus]